MLVGERSYGLLSAFAFAVDASHGNLFCILVLSGVLMQRALQEGQTPSPKVSTRRAPGDAASFREMRATPKILDASAAAIPDRCFRLTVVQTEPKSCGSCGRIRFSGFSGVCSKPVAAPALRPDCRAQSRAAVGITFAL